MKIHFIHLNKELELTKEYQYGYSNLWFKEDDEGNIHVAEKKRKYFKEIKNYFFKK